MLAELLLAIQNASADKGEEMLTGVAPNPSARIRNCTPEPEQTSPVPAPRKHIAFLGQAPGQTLHASLEASQPTSALLPGMRQAPKVQ
jgi:hypothetical protein